VRALLIHAASPDAAAFYLRHDPAFVSVPDHPLHLCLLMKDLRKAIREMPPRSSVVEPPVSDG